MISHQYKCIFIHIPKCAGTSIEQAMGHFANHQGRWGQDHRTISEIERGTLAPPAPSFKELVRRTLRMDRSAKKPRGNPNNRLVVTREQYDEYYKFAIVRNPWARVFSFYRNVMRDELKKKDYQISGETPFKDFLRENVGKGSLRPQTDWLKSLDGSIHLDFIGRFETLREDFGKACEAMGIPPIDLPHEIRGAGENYVKCYDEESVGIVANAYKEEIGMFNYSFGPGL